ncbi:MAG: hypothetical protein K2P41_11150, partial [Lachnospiraceae bacterium]|nr:hypothetical protein [Lachnospiraceae bacterium]
MRKFHKLISTVLATAMVMSLLAGCGSGGNADSASDAGDGADAAQEGTAYAGTDAAESDAEESSKPV